MGSIRAYYRRLSWLLLPIVTVFSVYYYTSSPSSIIINIGTLNEVPDEHLDHQSTSPFSTSTKSAIDTTTVKKCVPYEISDTRPFFEREPLRTNLPRRISNSSRKHLEHRLRSLRLAVVACAKNVEQDIDRFRNYVEPIIDLFHPSSRIIIFESDSKDNTFAKFKQWSRAEVYTYGNLSASILDRSQRIGFCRSELLKKARQIEPDYMLILDVDIFAVNVTSFLTNFEYDTDDWSVMTANLINTYYDIWALRTLSDTVLNYDVWREVDKMESTTNYCRDSLEQNIIYNHKKPYPIDRELSEVRSAFDGAAIYKMNATEGCGYTNEKYACEHVAFHLCMRNKNKARLFINSKFTNEEQYQNL